MPLQYENLDERTRALMVEEMDTDLAAGTLYVSSYLASPAPAYVALLKQAASVHDDAWLAHQIRDGRHLASYHPRKTPSGGTTMAKVPVTAPETLADGEFNHYYVRALCRRALESGADYVQVYRAKQVMNPRPESQARIGALIQAAALLADLRSHQGMEPALGVPPGPNSGLSVRLVNRQ